MKLVDILRSTRADGLLPYAVMLFAVTVGCVSAISQEKAPAAAPAKVALPATGADSGPLRILMSASTAHIIQGAAYDLSTRFENVSSTPVLVDLAGLQLTAQPEVAPSDSSCTLFYQPTFNRVAGNMLTLLPGDHFTVFFDFGEKESQETKKQDSTCQADSWGSLRKSIDFVPGVYDFVLTGRYLLSGAAVKDPVKRKRAKSTSIAPTPVATDMHFFSTTVALPVGIDQFQTIIYAGLGGFFAWLVTSFREQRAVAADGFTRYRFSVRATLMIFRQIAGAILLSTTVTIVASRLSTTTFPLKVSVDDFWGALTVGFVSYFIGGKFVDKLAESLDKAAAPA